MHRTQLISPFNIRMPPFPSIYMMQARTAPTSLPNLSVHGAPLEQRRPAGCKLVTNKESDADHRASWFRRPEGYLQLRWKRWPSSSLQRRWRRPMPPTAIALGWSSTYTSSIGGGQVYGQLAVAWLSFSCGGFQICPMLITTSRFILNVGIGLIVESRCRVTNGDTRNCWALLTIVDRDNYNRRLFWKLLVILSNSQWYSITQSAISKPSANNTIPEGQSANSYSSRLKLGF